MTNLIASRRRQWITRGRVLVGLPMAFGLLLCVPLVVVFLRPTWQNVQELGRRRDSLLQLQRNLPAVEAKLEAETAALEGAAQQQASLIGLLAGQDKVQTLLALLPQCRLAGQSRFQMTVRRLPLVSHIATQTEPALAKQKSMRGVAVIGCFAAL